MIIIHRIKIILFFLILFSTELWAGPTVIRDNRIVDLSITPVLGRGYSIGTNTFQSTCMQNVVTTEPSYDMKYSFIQLEDKGEEKKSSTESKAVKKTKSERKSGKKSNTWAKYSLFGGAKAGGTYSSTSSGVDQSINSIAKSTVIDGKTWYSHSMLVTINLYSYYASLDEAQSKMSDSAASLLIGKDLPGFFSSCGPYYVRSIGRHSTFVSIFTYQTETTTRDTSFENQLKTDLSGFSTQSKTKWSAKGGVGFLSAKASVSTNKQSQSLSTRDIQENKRKNDFHSQSESYRLTINTSAYGLGKDKKATLISFDMDSFKAAVKDAFLSMQNPHTGKVSSMEVVPWVENTEFQSLVKLEEKVIKPKEGEEEEEPEKLLLYEKKHILNANAEFLMEIDRSDRNKMNMYYKARLCKKNIDVNWKDGDSLKEDFEDAILTNHRGGSGTTLKIVNEKLTEEFVADLLLKEKTFMYGIAEDKEDNGASGCIRKIMLNGIYMKSYRDIPECQKVLEQLGDVQSELIENYCMPELKR